MRFQWDQAKNRTNLRDHHIDLADVGAMFTGPAWERLDDRQDYAEERWLAVGMLKGLEITVVYTDLPTKQGVVRRIISARRATRHEREAYHREIGG